MEGMHNDVLKLYAEIIEITENQTLRWIRESGLELPIYQAIQMI
jgi:hypothetical protein